MIELYITNNGMDYIKKSYSQLKIVYDNIIPSVFVG